jgi:transposase
MMGAAVRLREDFSGEALRALAAKSQDGRQVRRLMALAAVADGMSRSAAAAVGLMDRQTLRDWVIRFNAAGPEGLINRTSPGRPAKLTAEHRQELARLVDDKPEDHGREVVRWRRIDLADEAERRFGVACHETTIGRVLRDLGFAHISPRPRHPDQEEGAAEDFKKNSRKPLAS